MASPAAASSLDENGGVTGESRPRNELTPKRGPARLFGSPAGINPTSQEKDSTSQKYRIEKSISDVGDSGNLDNFSTPVTSCDEVRALVQASVAVKSSVTDTFAAITVTFDLAQRCVGVPSIDWLRSALNEELNASYDDTTLVGRSPGKLTASRRAKSIVVNLRENQLDGIGLSGFLDVFGKPSVVELDLSFNRIGIEGLIAVGKLLAASKTLKRLFLSGNDFAYASEGLHALAEGLAQAHCIEILSLHRCTLSASGVESLAPGIGDNVTLTYVDLSWNHISTNGLRALAEALHEGERRKISTLELGWNGIGAEGIDALLLLLESLPNISVLGLAGNQLGSQGLVAICDHFSREGQNASITNISLFRNNIRDDGVEKLAVFLQENASLTSIDIEQNPLGIAGVKALSQALVSNHHIRALAITSNVTRGESLSTDDDGEEKYDDVASQYSSFVQEIRRYIERNASEHREDMDARRNELFVGALAVGPNNRIRNDTDTSIGPSIVKKSTSSPSAFDLVSPAEWTNTQVAGWLRWQGFSEPIVALFEEQQIDGSILDQVDDELLKGQEFDIEDPLLRRALVTSCRVAATTDKWLTDGSDGHERFWTVKQVQDWIQARLGKNLDPDLVDEICANIEEHCIHGELFTHLDKTELQNLLPSRRKSGPKLKAQKLLQEKAFFARTRSSSLGQNLLHSAILTDHSEGYTTSMPMADLIHIPSSASAAPDTPNYQVVHCLECGTALNAEIGEVQCPVCGAPLPPPLPLSGGYQTSGARSSLYRPNLGSPSQSSLRRRSSSLLSRVSSADNSPSSSRRAYSNRMLVEVARQRSDSQQSWRMRTQKEEMKRKKERFKEQLVTAAMVSVFTSVSLLFLFTVAQSWRGSGYPSSRPNP